MSIWTTQTGLGGIFLKEEKRKNRIEEEEGEDGGGGGGDGEDNDNKKKGRDGEGEGGNRGGRREGCHVMSFINKIKATKVVEQQCHQ